MDLRERVVAAVAEEGLSVGRRRLVLASAARRSSRRSWGFLRGGRRGGRRYRCRSRRRYRHRGAAAARRLANIIHGPNRHMGKNCRSIERYLYNFRRHENLLALKTSAGSWRSPSSHPGVSERPPPFVISERDGSAPADVRADANFIRQRRDLDRGNPSETATATQQAFTQDPTSAGPRRPRSD